MSVNAHDHDQQRLCVRVRTPVYTLKSARQHTRPAPLLGACSDVSVNAHDHDPTACVCAAGTQTKRGYLPSMVFVISIVFFWNVNHCCSSALQGITMAIMICFIKSSNRCNDGSRLSSLHQPLSLQSFCLRAMSTDRALRVRFGTSIYVFARSLLAFSGSPQKKDCAKQNG